MVQGRTICKFSFPEFNIFVSNPISLLLYAVALINDTTNVFFRKIVKTPTPILLNMSQLMSQKIGTYPDELTDTLTV